MTMPSSHEQPQEQPWILLVEDEPDIAESITEVLTSNGYRVMHSARTADAITKLCNQLFACLILDMRLADGNSGEEIITYTRNSTKELNATTPIVVTSGHLDAELVKRIGHHVAGVLVKPFSPAMLLTKVQAAIGIRKN